MLYYISTMDSLYGMQIKTSMGILSDKNCYNCNNLLVKTLDFTPFSDTLTF